MAAFKPTFQPRERGAPFTAWLLGALAGDLGCLPFDPAPSRA